MDSLRAPWMLSSLKTNMALILLPATGPTLCSIVACPPTGRNQSSPQPCTWAWLPPTSNPMIQAFLGCLHRTSHTGQGRGCGSLPWHCFQQWPTGESLHCPQDRPGANGGANTHKAEQTWASVWVCVCGFDSGCKWMMVGECVLVKMCM